MIWLIVLEIVGVIGGIAAAMGLVLAPMFYLGNKIDAVSKDLQDCRKEMHQENKDFHSRLLILEERYLKLMEKK